MRRDKHNRAMQEYNGFGGNQTIRHIMSTIPDTLINNITGKQVGQVMSIRNASYHEGIGVGERHEQSDGCVWTGEALIPLEIIKQIKILEQTESKIVPCIYPDQSYRFGSIYHDAACTDRVWDPCGLPCKCEEGKYWMIETIKITKYTLNAKE